MKPFDPHALIDAVAASLDLPIPPERRDEVAGNLARLHALACELIDFPLPDADDADLPGPTR